MVVDCIRSRYQGKAPLLSHGGAPINFIGAPLSHKGAPLTHPIPLGNGAPLGDGAPLRDGAPYKFVRTTFSVVTPLICKA